MSTIEKRIEVECPRTVVYDQWTQFELFPQFMDGVTLVYEKMGNLISAHMTKTFNKVSS